jgi:hypothetical protein
VSTAATRCVVCVVSEHAARRALSDGLPLDKVVADLMVTFYAYGKGDLDVTMCADHEAHVAVTLAGLEEGQALAAETLSEIAKMKGAG